MQEIFHELDPDGDVMLVLHSPQTAFAVWDNDQEYLPPLPLLKRRASPPESIVFVEIGPDYEYQWNQREQVASPLRHTEQRLTVPADYNTTLPGIPPIRRRGSDTIGRTRRGTDAGLF
jgi:hypothetical protein